MISYSTYTDGQLLELLKGGDEKAFTEIYNRYWDKLFVVAAHRLGGEAEAKEIVQNVFFNLWKKRTGLQIKYTLSTYLATAVKYEVLNLLASNNRRQRFEQYQLQHLDAVSNDTQNQVDFHELQEQVTKLVQGLPEKCRIVFELRQQGISQKEVAGALQISEKTVEAHTFRALRQLKTGLYDTVAIIVFLFFFFSH